MTAVASIADSGVSLAVLQQQLKADQHQLLEHKLQAPQPTIVPTVQQAQMVVESDQAAIQLAQLQMLSMQVGKANPDLFSVQAPSEAVAPVSGPTVDYFA